MAKFSAPSCGALPQVKPLPAAPTSHSGMNSDPGFPLPVQLLLRPCRLAGDQEEDPGFSLPQPQSHLGSESGDGKPLLLSLSSFSFSLSFSLLYKEIEPVFSKAPSLIPGGLRKSNSHPTAACLSSHGSILTPAQTHSY